VEQQTMIAAVDRAMDDDTAINQSPCAFVALP
jgi:hypothetical protein